MCETFQRSINRMSRATLGTLPSTPIAFLQAEGGSLPARARLDRRQESFAVRLASTVSGPHTHLLRATSGLGQRISRMVPEAVGHEVEGIRVSLGRSCPGEEKEKGIETSIRQAMEKERDPYTIWTDGSRLDDGRVGAGVAWYEEVAEVRERVFIGRRDFRTAGQRKRRDHLSWEAQVRQGSRVWMEEQRIRNWRWTRGLGRGVGGPGIRPDSPTRQGRDRSGLLDLHGLQGSHGESDPRHSGPRAIHGHTDHRAGTESRRSGKFRHDKMDTGTQGS